MKKKVIAVLLCCAMAMASIGCGNNETQEQSKEVSESKTEESSAAESQPEETVDADPFGGYEEPITLTTIIHQTVTQACPEGITLTENPWQELWKSKGINVEYAYVAADNSETATKVNLAIASGEIPDFMSVSAATYQELLEADMIMDLTDVFEQYASDELKNMMYADGGVMAENVTEDGRLYGLVQPADYYDQGAVVAIRTDWLEELGMEAPTSIDGLWELAEAFVENNMGGTCTIGIGATKEISSMLAMKYIINAHGGKTSTWMEKDGELVYGLIQPEMKQALSELHDKYASGLLDQEYGTKSEQQLFEDAVSGKSGIVVCNMTAPFYLDNGIELGQEWSYYPLYAEEGQYSETEVSVAFSNCVVVSKECKNPEAVIKLFNMSIYYATQEGEIYASDGINNLAYPTLLSRVGQNHAIYEAYKVYVETGEEPEDLTGYEGTFEACDKWRLNQDSEGRTLYWVFGEEGATQAALSAEIAGGGYFISAYTAAPGEASVKYSGNLGTMADQMITNIITGAESVDYFDQFVEIWKANGGDEITAEVNEWYQSNK